MVSKRKGLLSTSKPLFPTLLPRSSSSPWRPRASSTATSSPPRWSPALAASSMTSQSTLVLVLVNWASLHTSVIATAEFLWCSASLGIGDVQNHIWSKRQKIKFQHPWICNSLNLLVVWYLLKFPSIFNVGRKEKVDDDYMWCTF